MSKKIIAAAVAGALSAVGVLALRNPEGKRVHVPDGALLPEWVPPGTREELLKLGAAAPATPVTAAVAETAPDPSATTEQQPASGADSAGTNTPAAEKAAEADVSGDGAAGNTAAPDSASTAEGAAATEDAQKTAPSGGKTAGKTTAKKSAAD